MLPSSGYTRLNTVRSSLNLAYVIDGILALVQHEIARYGARVVRKKRGGSVIHVKLKSCLRHVGPTVPYLNINLIPCFLRYSWLARPALHVLQCMTWLVEVGRNRKVIPAVDDISTVFSKTVCQPASSLPNVHYRWTLGARQAINHVFSDAGKMSRDVNMPFGRFNCGWWINMGTCAANGPEHRRLSGVPRIWRIC